MGISIRRNVTLLQSRASRQCLFIPRRRSGWASGRDEQPFPTHRVVGQKGHDRTLRQAGHHHLHDPSCSHHAPVFTHTVSRPPPLPFPLAFSPRLSLPLFLPPPLPASLPHLSFAPLSLACPSSPILVPFPSLSHNLSSSSSSSFRLCPRFVAYPRHRPFLPLPRKLLFLFTCFFLCPSSSSSPASSNGSSSCLFLSLLLFLCAGLLLRLSCASSLSSSFPLSLLFVVLVLVHCPS